MYRIFYTNRMKHDVKIMQKRGKDLNKLIQVLDILAKGIDVPVKLKDHQLTGNFNGFRECYIEPNWILLYQIHDKELILVASATGTHSDLFQ